MRPSNSVRVRPSPSASTFPRADATRPAAAGTVELAVTTDEGTATGTLTPDDPFDTLSRLNNSDCLAESVATVAEITMPEHVRSTGTGADRRAVIDVAGHARGIRRRLDAHRAGREHDTAQQRERR